MAQYGKASYWDERYTKYVACECVADCEKKTCCLVDGCRRSLRDASYAIMLMSVSCVATLQRLGAV